MKLYRITIEMMAVGTDEGDALSAASSADFDACDTEVEEVTAEDEILPGWENVLPWGDQRNDELDCAELLKERQVHHDK